jgi:hypothetical protein
VGSFEEAACHIAAPRAAAVEPEHFVAVAAVAAAQECLEEVPPKLQQMAAQAATLRMEALIHTDSAAERNRGMVILVALLTEAGGSMGWVEGDLVACWACLLLAEVWKVDLLKEPRRFEAASERLRAGKQK